jgi:hypothetical protein
MSQPFSLLAKKLSFFFQFWLAGLLLCSENNYVLMLNAEMNKSRPHDVHMFCMEEHDHL